MIARTVDRVSANTVTCVNEAIRQRTEERVAECAVRGRAAIDRRLEELDVEWDVERLLECNASIACLVGVSLGITVDRRWFLFPGVIAGFLLLHAVEGWCPPLPVLRRFGVRTASEIADERYALKALRGDFRNIGGNERQTPSGAEDALDAAQS